MTPQSIAAVNQLKLEEKTSIYRRFIPEILRERFGISSDFNDELGRELLQIECKAGSTEVILDLRHLFAAEDPLLYAHITDTVNGQLHILLFIVNNPDSRRFDVDCLPDGTKTGFGTVHRNVKAELSAMSAGLAPGQVRRGLRILQYSIPMGWCTWVFCVDWLVFSPARPMWQKSPRLVKSFLCKKD